MKSYQELLDAQKSRKIVQIGFLTSDLQRSMDMWIEKNNVGPWRVCTMNNQSVSGNGFLVDGAMVDEPFQYFIAISYIGDMQVELIQPDYGPTIYQKFIDEHGEGIHHYKELIAQKNWDATLERYEALGMPVTMKGQFGLAKYAYVDSEQFLDYQVEFGDNIPNPTWPEGSNVHYYPPEE